MEYIVRGHTIIHVAVIYMERDREQQQEEFTMRRMQKRTTGFRYHPLTMTVCLATAVTVCTSAWGGDEVRYRATSLGTLGGFGSGSISINEIGVVTGSADIDSYPTKWHGFIWEPGGEMIDLGILVEGDDSYGHDINNFGQIVGASYWLYNGEAFIWEDGVMSGLGKYHGLPRSDAQAINDFGVIVGEAWDDREWDSSKAILWIGTNMIELDPLPGHLGATAYDINNFGTIIGSSWTERGTESDARGWVLREGEMFEIPTFGGSSSWAAAVNDLDEVVGYARDESETVRAFYWHDGIMEDLPTFENVYCSARGLNNFGQIVGSREVEPYWYHAVLWQNEQIYDLNDLLLRTGGPEIELLGAADVNDAGTIGATGWIDGHRMAVVLSPVPYVLMEGPFPGFAGEVNLFEFSGATPGGVVFLIYGFERGSTPLPGCEGLTLDIGSPRTAVATIADDEGRAVLGGLVPREAEGVTVLFQGFDQSGCAISDLIVHEF